MHILFIHSNYPAQFGHIAKELARRKGTRCTFLSRKPPGEAGGITRLQYEVEGGATRKTHYCSRSFENYTWHSHAVYKALRARPDLRPDLVVGHSGFGSTVFLKELYRCPIINYFEYFYASRDSDVDFRPDQSVRPLERMRAHARNAASLLDLQTCDAGYSPTQWQRSRFPQEYQPKISTLFDGVDTRLWHPRRSSSGQVRQIAGRQIPEGTRIVTYVSRGFEAMRGFDVFMKVAKRIYQARNDVIFVCVGSDRVCYGGDRKRIQGESYREHVLAQDSYDLDRFLFTGRVPPKELADILRLSDLHIYLTVPFVLSWSMINAMACGCTVLASATPPVMEAIEHGRNGLLAPFFDVEELTRLACLFWRTPRNTQGSARRLSRTFENDTAST